MYLVVLLFQRPIAKAAVAPPYMPEEAPKTLQACVVACGREPSTEVAWQRVQPIPIPIPTLFHSPCLSLLLLHSLDLSDNCITQDGAQFLTKALHKNATLQELRLRGNGLEEHGGKQLEALLRVNGTLRVLDTGGCGIHAKLQRRITLLIEMNAHAALVKNALVDALDNVATTDSIDFRSALALQTAFPSASPSHVEFFDRKSLYQPKTPSMMQVIPKNPQGQQGGVVVEELWGRILLDIAGAWQHFEKVKA